MTQKLDYNEQGMAAVLRGARDLIDRASHLYSEIKTGITPPIVSAAFRKEANLCLAEAAELIAKVRSE